MTEKNEYYIFFTKTVLPQPNKASVVQFVNCANAAANIGYPAVLVHLDRSWRAFNPMKWIHPGRLNHPKRSLVEAYSVQGKLKTITLPNPWPIDYLLKCKISSAGLSKRYFLPKHVFPKTKLFYTRDWNFAKLAVKMKIPTIFEWHFPVKEYFNSEIVNSDFFKLAVANTNFVKNSLIKHGIPEEKVLQMHNGINNFFLTRQPKEAEKWRAKLLADGRKYLAVYAGGLYRFKGVDLLIDVAKNLPEVQFVLAGGNNSQVRDYKKMSQDKNTTNIMFLGHISHTKLTSLLQAADVLLHPHLSGEASTFTSPLKFFEYLASGTPLVVTRISPLMEFRSKNVAIGWCSPDKPLEFMKCIRYVLEKYTRKKGGYGGNIDFARQFTWENRIRSIFEYIHNHDKFSKALKTQA